MSHLDCELSNGQTPLMYAISQNKKEVAKALIKAGADPNAGASTGHRPLLDAVLRGNDDLVKLLIDAGADSGEVAAKVGYRAYAGDEQYERVLDTADKVDKISSSIKTVFYTKLAGHALHFKGNIELTGGSKVSLEKGRIAGWCKEMADSTEKLAEKLTEESQINQLDQLEGSLRSVSDQARKEADEILLEINSSEGGVLLTTGYSGATNHSLMVLFFDDLFVVCNRGAYSGGQLKTSSFVLDPNVVTLELVEEIIGLKNKSEEYFGEFIESLPKRKGFSKKNKRAKEFDNACHLPHQWVGNCSWTSAETGVWATMLAGNLKAAGGNKRARSEAIKKTRQQFTEWVNFQRIRSTQLYMDKLDPKDYNRDFLLKQFEQLYQIRHETPITKEALQKVEKQAVAYFNSDSRLKHNIITLKTIKEFWTKVPLHEELKDRFIREEKRRKFINISSIGYDRKFNPRWSKSAPS
ncbi:hypothetical protein SCG7086_CD_00030 [Chlamydiales bacterium SCGC AG-110-P3]|nr:hypothetical protein SCG7086_CD_00030 [Chlamydiales bacterium SCGC AG-110-P3]